MCRRCVGPSRRRDPIQPSPSSGCVILYNIPNFPCQPVYSVPVLIAGPSFPTTSLRHSFPFSCMENRSATHIAPCPLAWEAHVMAWMGWEWCKQVTKSG